MHIQPMHIRRGRLAIAGVIAAAAIAVPPAAFASGFGSAPSGKPVASPGSGPGSQSACATAACKAKASEAAGKSPAAPLTVPGLSADQLQAGLNAAKRAGGNTPAGVAAFAAAAGVSQATAERAVQEVFGSQGAGKTGDPKTGEPKAGEPKAGEPESTAAFAAALASQLGVSTSAAQRAVDQIESLDRGGIDPANPAFAVIARDLGVTPDRLAAALAAAKGSLASQQDAGK